MRKFDFLEHTADVYIAAYGGTLEEAFENAALATFEVMTDIQKVKPYVKESVEVEAQDQAALLYSWLEELLVRFETTSKLFSRFEVSSIEKTHEGFRLRARIWGELFNPKKHLQKVGVKAVTYHRMEIMRKPEEVIIKFILDI